ncbi:MAG TPA: creatininase family protein [Thermomicrobiales bacterium]|nr:creatininase family protein [Thermomicrobiales bacterium]
MMGTEGEARWSKLTRDRIAELAKHAPVLIQPIGAIEQHGPHLTVDTDACGVTAIAEQVAANLGPTQALVLPTIAWGLSPYWLPFAGTISLRPETILAVMADIGRSVAAHGFRQMLILNGHGGNAGIIAVVATQMADLGIRAVALPYWAVAGEDLGKLAPADLGHIGHAGQTETSIQLHLQSEVVGTGYRDVSTWADLGPLLGGLSMPGAYAPPLPALESPNGVYGNPTKASAEIGEAIIDLVVERLGAYVMAFAAQPV